MPLVTIQVTREGIKPGVDSVTAEEKAELIKGISHLLLDVRNSRSKRPLWSSRK
jgi:4-oxalocrotonate tautomerase